MFDDLVAAEQSCIRDALGDDLEWVLTQAVLPQVVDYFTFWEESIYECLDPEIARSVFLYAIRAYIKELSEEEFLCVQEWVFGVSVAALLASPNDSDERAEFVVKVAHCAPNLLFSGRILEWGLTLEDVSEEEAACLRGKAEEIDLTALMTTNNEVEEEFQASLASCLPDLALHLALSEFGLGLADLTEEEAACLRKSEPIESEDFPAILNACVSDRVVRAMLSSLGIKLDDLTEEQRYCLRAVSEGLDLLLCVPDLVIPMVLWLNGIALEELSEQEVYCLREQVADFDVAALYSVLFSVDLDGTVKSEELLTDLFSCLPETAVYKH